MEIKENKIKSLCKKFKKKFLKPTIAIISLRGVILSGKSGLKSGLNIENLASSIEEAFKKPRLKEVILFINSPGGSPAQSELIYKKIKLEAKKANIPVTAFAEDVAASGGYYIACAADKIYSLENTIIGSIGVISAGFGFEKAIEKLGINRRIYTQGENKSILDPFMPEKKQDIELIKEIQNNIHDNFKNVVRESRKDKLNLDEEELFSGKFWAGKSAKEIGLIDEIGDFYTIIHEKYGDEVKIEIINQNKSWLKKNLSMYADTFLDKVIAQLKNQTLWDKLGINH